MKVGINLYTKWPYKEVIEAFLENEIDSTFVCIDHPQFEEVMDALAEAGITVENFHAPFTGLNRIWYDCEEGEQMLERLLKGVDMCEKYGINIMVAHVSNGRPMTPVTDLGLERFDRFMQYAKSKGVTVAYESHRYVENVKYIMERYPEAGFCLDTAHEDAFTPGVRYMPLWGHRLVATHISDNEYVCDKDMHMIPFDGNIDFEKTAGELAEYNYDGCIMLEIKPDNHEKYKDMPIKEYYTSAVESVRRIAEMVKKKKQK